MTNGPGRRWIAVLCAVLGVAVLAGCLSGPIFDDRGQEGPVSVNLTNAATDTYEFRVLVVDGPPEDAAYYPQYTDRESEWTQFSPAGLSNTDYADANVTSIQFRQHVTRQHDTVTLAPNETARTRIDEFETRDIVVVTVTSDGRVLALVTATCTGDLVGVVVFMRPYGADPGLYCR